MPAVSRALPLLYVNKLAAQELARSRVIPG